MEKSFTTEEQASWGVSAGPDLHSNGKASTRHVEQQDVHENNNGSGRGFLLIVALLSLVYNALVVVSCAYLPDDPLSISASIAGYAWLATGLSFVGLVGIVAKRPNLIIAFAHFLLLDTVVSAICRILVLQLFLEAFDDQSVCADLYEPTSRPEGLPHEVVTSAQWQRDHAATAQQRRCHLAASAFQLVVTAVLISLTAVQCTLGVAMRRLGKEIERAKEAKLTRRRSPIAEKVSIETA